MSEVKVFYDAPAHSLTVWFGRPEDERVCDEVGEGVILMKDGEGAVIGFEKLDFVADPEGLRVVVETGGGTPYGRAESPREHATSPGVAPGPTGVVDTGERVGFLISGEDLALFRRLVAREEDRLDVEAAREALREPGSVALEELERDVET